jgi:hypothetical protein
MDPPVRVASAQIRRGRAQSIWDDANDTLVAGWNYSDWTSDSSSDKNSELLCTNNTDSFEFSGIGEGEAVSGADFQYVTSLDPEIITCGY